MFLTPSAVEPTRLCFFSFSTVLVLVLVCVFSSLGDIERPATAESIRVSSSVMVLGWLCTRLVRLSMR